LLEGVTILFGVAQNQGVDGQRVLVVILDTSANERQTIAVVQTLALINVNLIHKAGRDNVVLDVLSGREEFQAMSMTQTL
jgi:hypothetical protein